MKFNCDALSDWLDKIETARILRLAHRHRWFAWYPVRIAPNDCRWLEPVWRWRKVLVWRVRGHNGETGIYRTRIFRWHYRPANSK